ncbi:STAS/SEC14 domain-containing protein [Bernardetia sp. ABR2-2B]|uniref:STAS/SEC14 domain-containing protein n=1 Tax=Bernardetia sp. ABR2-2B TaxID=3127472 RepID=UPI0030CA9BDD
MSSLPIATFQFEKPFVYVSFTGNDFDDENFEEYKKSSHKAFEWERYGMIYDISKVEYVQTKYRTLQAEDIKKHKEQIENKAIGLAVIAPSFFQRTFAKTIFLIISYPSKVEVFESEEKAMKWMNKLLEK